MSMYVTDLLNVYGGILFFRTLRGKTNLHNIEFEILWLKKKQIQEENFFVWVIIRLGSQWFKKSGFLCIVSFVEL